MGKKLVRFIKILSKQIIAYYLFVLLITISCVGDQSVIRNEVKQTLSNLNLNVEISVNEKNDYLSLSFTFFSPQYFDTESKKIILGYLISESYDVLKKYSQVIFIYRNEGFNTDVKEFIYSDDNIIKVYNKFNNNIIFKNFVSYTIKEMNQNEVLYGNLIIKQLPEFVPEFNFFGSYWLLLYNYSQSCEKNDKNKELNFLIFAKTAAIEGSGISKEHIKYFLNNCGHNVSELGI